MEATDSPSQISELERQMQRADTDWEALTRSIQADTCCLATSQERLDNLRLLLSLLPGDSPGAAPAMAAQIALLEQRIAWLGQRIGFQRARRKALEEQFDRARLTRAVLRRALQKPPSRLALARKFLASGAKRSLKGFWAFLTRPENYSGIIPTDAWLHDHASTGGQ